MEPGADNGAHKDTDGPARTTPERLVEAGITLFSDQGFKGTTVGELEQAAGLTPRRPSFLRCVQLRQSQRSGIA